MDHQTALDIARSLRVRGRRAKYLSGDKSRVITATGVLTDANEDIVEAQRLQDPTARYK